MWMSFLNSTKSISPVAVVLLCLTLCPKQTNAYELPPTLAKGALQGPNFLGFESQRLENFQPSPYKMRLAFLKTFTLTGDYNNDHIVDSSDYEVWRGTLGKSVECGEGADGDCNGVIDLADYDIWHKNFGTTVSPIKAIEVSWLVKLQLTLCLAALVYTNVSYRIRRRSGHNQEIGSLQVRRPHLTS